MNLEYKFKSQTFILDPEKAIYWEQKDALFLSDLHLGKSKHFRKSGIGIPSEENNFNRIKKILIKYNPSKIFFLGDLFHSTANSAIADFKNFFSNFNIEKYLILGNHDILKNDIYEELELKTYRSYQFDDFELLHDPEDHNEKYAICGHVHPKVRLRGKGRQYMTLPCFYFGSDFAILPAFGDFTGGYVITADKEDKVFVIAENEVIAMS